MMPSKGDGRWIACFPAMNAAVMLMANVPKHLLRESLLLVPDWASFKEQEATFAGLNLFLLIALLATNILFPAYFGEPPALLYAVLLTAITANALDLFWSNRGRMLDAAGIAGLTWTMIALNVAVAFALASLSYRQDVQYFALMIVPIFQAAFRLSLGATILTVSVSAALIFFWVWNYFRLHGGWDLNEYLEAGTISLIFAVCGLLVWTLMNHLRAKQNELEKAKAKLLVEEKLAAVGRFSSAIAHEIRNPVAMICSALTTAANNPPGSDESKEMFEIASSEAARLEKLTNDFLAYAKPGTPVKQRNDVADSIGYIADICRPRALSLGVAVQCETPECLWAEVDAGQLQQALLNLAMNAIEASSSSPDGSAVLLRGSRENGRIRIAVENGNGPIPAEAVKCIFEPFFTTKSAGTGLGLAIARSFALAHGGDLVLSRNQKDLVQFSIILPALKEAH
jgi:signal transduction histidine kinase